MLRKLESVSSARELKQPAWLVQLSKARQKRQCGYTSQNCHVNVGKNCREGPKRNIDTRTNKTNYIFTRNEKQWYSVSSTANAAKLDKISTFRVGLLFSSECWGYNPHVCDRRTVKWMSHLTPSALCLYHILASTFRNTECYSSRGFVTSKPSALPYLWKINIFEGSDYITRDIPSHKKC